MFAPEAVVTHPTYEKSRPFLRKFVEANLTYAVREARAGRTPSGVRLREWVPVVQTVRSRRRRGTSMLLNRRRMSDSGIRPTPMDDALALPLIYVVLPYVRTTSQLVGYARVRTRRAGASPRQQAST